MARLRKGRSAGTIGIKSGAIARRGQVGSLARWRHSQSFFAVSTDRSRAASGSAQDQQKKNDRQAAEDHGMSRSVVQESDERQRNGCEQSRLEDQPCRAGMR